MSSAAVLDAAAGRSPEGASPWPKLFELEWVTLSKREHIELVMQAKQWKSLHERAVRRFEFADKRHQFEIAQARQREDRLRSELDAARAEIRDLRQRVFGTKTEQSSSIDVVALPLKNVLHS